MKLLVISDSFLPRWDGVARFLSEILPSLMKDYEITLLAPDTGAYSPLGYKIHRLATTMFSIDDFPIARPSWTTMQKCVKEADLVWVQTLSVLGIQGIRAAKKLKKSVLFFTHVIDWEIINKAVPGPRFWKNFLSGIAILVARKYYNKCDMLMIPSTDVLFKLEQNRVTAPKVLVPLGIDTMKFKPPISKIEAKNSIGLNPDDFVIGFIGRIGREKDLPTLFEAFKYIHKLNRHAVLLIVGKGIVNPEMEKHPNVVLTGSKDNVIPYYQAMDVFVLPSLTETTSLATLEAMACGLPVVTTPLGCIRAYVKNAENGLFFPKQNVLVLRKKLQQLMNSKSLRKDLGSAARWTVEHHYSWKTTVQKVKDVLKEF